MTTCGDCFQDNWPKCCDQAKDQYDNAHDAFTIQHCTAWCESAGVDLENDGPDSKLSWPTVARLVQATYTDGIEYR